MVTTLLRIFWPHLERYLAKRAAAYLQSRHDRRFQKNDSPAEMEPVTAEALLTAPTRGGLLANNSLWYTLAGILLGSAIAVAVTQMMAEGERR